jgi:hypothetical protein
MKANSLCHRGVRATNGHLDHAAEKCNELAPLHRADPKLKDQGEYSRSGPCIAAKAAAFVRYGSWLCENSSARATFRNISEQSHP